jgi:hypothetical protein
MLGQGRLRALPVRHDPGSPGWAARSRRAVPRSGHDELDVQAFAIERGLEER